MKNIKTITNLVLFLLLVGTINAQRSTVSHEQLSNDGLYKFWIEAEDEAVDQLVGLYFQIIQQPAVAEFSGSKTHSLAGGIMLSIDTEQQALVVLYEGTDERILNNAKGLGHKLTQYLENVSPVAAEQAATPARNTVAVTNNAGGHYNFHIVVAEDQLPELITTFIDLSGEQLATDFKGQHQIILDGDIIMSINTENYTLMVNYEGKDRDIKGRARAIGERANAYLGGHGQR